MCLLWYVCFVAVFSLSQRVHARLFAGFSGNDGIGCILIVCGAEYVGKVNG